jgi:hypothetical protein
MIRFLNGRVRGAAVSALTLIELLIATTLLSLIVLAAFSLDGVSRSFMGSSQRLSVVEADVVYAMDRITKIAVRVHGDSFNQGYSSGEDTKSLESPGCGVAPGGVRNVTKTPQIFLRIDDPQSPTPSRYDDDLFYYLKSFDVLTQETCAYGGNPGTVNSQVSQGEVALCQVSTWLDATTCNATTREVFPRVKEITFGPHASADGVIVGLDLTVNGCYNADETMNTHSNPCVKKSSTVYFEGSSTG